ncbi:MAG: hypothetical protein BIP78_0866 [Candidatus Bipolaricaulis sibiricus]|uniref:DUF4139 domain-containing protein n=1 Tax=Bipolaricaulis sibiricus TaxID=2501609 RepID=A0A410FUH6_BIPS1|nr:MAG: hypothetical protein BIP78_0866 [Candidatus Bipolaricaulis sibiricus]
MLRRMAVGVFLFGVTTGVAAPVVTLYSGGFGYIHEVRTVHVAQEGDLVLDALPLTLVLDSLVLDGLTVIRLDPVRPTVPSIADLVGTTVTVFAHGERLQGRLIATTPDLVLATPEGWVFLPSYERMVASAPPSTSPIDQLSVRVRYRDATPGESTVGLRYLANGLSWRAAYTAVLDDDTLSLWGLVTLENQSGVEFMGAQVSLVAGDVYRPTGTAPVGYGTRALAAFAEFDVGAAFEYHRYTFPTPVDLTAGVAVAPLLAGEVMFARAYRFSGGPVEVRVRFTNALGPLPGGEVRVYDMKGALFVGAATLGHTPVGSDVDLAIGAAFDLTGERVQEARVRIADNFYRDTYRITLRSAKDTPVEVEVVESLSGTWIVTQHSLPYERLDAQRILFRVSVPAGGSAEVRYTVEWRY